MHNLAKILRDENRDLQVIQLHTDHHNTYVERGGRICERELHVDLPGERLTVPRARGKLKKLGTHTAAIKGSEQPLFLLARVSRAAL